ncbi:MAG: hypothetical protein AAGD09_11580 [Cyanobacteria bacterium P01_F01_bin.56]
MTTPKKPGLKTYHASADLVLGDNSLMQANTDRDLDPADPIVAAFIKADKLKLVEPAKAGAEPAK